MKVYTDTFGECSVSRESDDVGAFINAVVGLSERTMSNLYLDPQRSVCLFNARSGVLFVPQKAGLPKGYNVYAE